MKYLIAIIFLVSCSTQRAMQRVRLHPEAFNSIGKEWRDLNPCVNDTTTEIIFSPIDSILQTDTQVVMMDIPYLDTLAVKEAYNKGFEMAKRLCKQHPTTIIKTIVDKTLEKQLREEVAALKNESKNKSDMLQKKQEQNKKFIYIIIGLSVVIIGYISVKLFR